MTEAPPMIFTWDGEHMVPRHGRIADRYFVVGETYELVEHHQRSLNSHNHYFASLSEAWKNLPEDMAERFATVEHLRKYALIKAGYADSASIVCASKAEAQRVAMFVRPADEFSIVTVSEATVTRWTAKSQSMRSMGKAEFQKSKDAVLEIVAAMISVEPRQLAQNAGRAA